MYEESKKLKLLKLIVMIFSLVIIVFIIIVFQKCKTTIDNTIDYETTNETKEEKIIFDLSKAPYEQKNKIRGHVEEYDDQVYHYLFDDEKMINTAKYSGVTDYYHLVENYGDNVFYIYTRRPLNNLINMIFLDEDIDYSQYAFTENYIKKHPVSLRKEFSQYFKEDYRKPGKGKLYDMDYEYKYSYGYNIGCDRENQFAVVDVSKSISYVCEDGTSGSLWGKKGSKYEGKELYAELKTIYFKYKLDEKGYLDDIWFDHTEVLNSEQDLDNSVNFWGE